MRLIQLTGFIVNDAEKKVSKNGKEYITFRMGNNEFGDKDDNGNEKTLWFRVTSFNQRHFGMTQYLTKGKPIIVAGDYSDSLYQRNDGSCDVNRDIIANGIYFVFDGNGQNKQKNNQSPQATNSAPTPKPSTAEIQIPSGQFNPNDDTDDLPF